jgi:alkylated DNA repair dioxygenase AlkB
MEDQLGLFGAPPASAFPSGFKYAPDLITRDAERALLAHIRELPFKEFEFHGYLGKRRVVSYGWRYDYAERRVHQAADMPGFLIPLRERAAAFAGLAADKLQQALVTEYEVGAPIGWHRDKPEFGAIVGVSLLAACTFRLRRKVGETWERFSIVAEPRSAYLMSGAVRTEWEHSIPPVSALRYSVTFRTVGEL